MGGPTAVLLVFAVLAAQGFAEQQIGLNQFQYVPQHLYFWHVDYACAYAASRLNVDYKPGHVIAVKGYGYSGTLGRWVRYIVEFKAQNRMTYLPMICRAYVHWPNDSRIHLDITNSQNGLNTCWPA